MILSENKDLKETDFVITKLYFIKSIPKCSPFGELKSKIKSRLYNQYSKISGYLFLIHLCSILDVPDELCHLLHIWNRKVWTKHKREDKAVTHPWETQSWVFHHHSASCSSCPLPSLEVCTPTHCSGQAATWQKRLQWSHSSASHTGDLPPCQPASLQMQNWKYGGSENASYKFKKRKN